MNTPKTTARPAVDLDATDEFPVLDAAAYEAEVLSRDSGEQTDSWATDTEADPSAVGFPAADHALPDIPRVAADSDAMLAVEHWIAQKTEELRAHHDALSLAQRERAAAVARASALSRELAETSANLDSLNGRERALEDALPSWMRRGARPPCWRSNWPTRARLKHGRTRRWQPPKHSSSSAPESFRRC